MNNKEEKFHMKLSKPWGWIAHVGLEKAVWIIKSELEKEFSFRLGQEIFKRLSKENKCVVISPPEIEEYGDFDMYSIEYDIQTKDVDFHEQVVWGGYRYKDTYVKSPHELSFRERWKFIFTGEYPE